MKLCRFAGLSLRTEMRSSDMQKKCSEEPAGETWGSGISASMSRQYETQRQIQDRLEDYISPLACLSNKVVEMSRKMMM